jgi:hypothetical protein
MRHEKLGERGMRSGRRRERPARFTIPFLALVGAACVAQDTRTTVDTTAETTSVAPRQVDSHYVASDSALAGVGSLAVSVTLADTTAGDTTIFPVRDFDTCGAQLTDNAVAKDRAGALGGALVWLTGVYGGKELPLRKRHELLHQACLLYPRTQAVATGGTLNIRNMDQAVHVLHFADAQTGETLARITQSERGQVVPNDFILDVPRVIAVTCEIHPWTKAWIHVFDHPYHAATDRAGRVTLDSIPAGQYRLVVWHERFGEQRSEVTIRRDARDTMAVVMVLRDPVSR